MKHTVNIKGRLQFMHTELPITHCLIGRRDYSFDAPPQEMLDRAAHPQSAALLSQEEYVEIHRYKHSLGENGKYSVNALAWAESAEAAEEMKERFPAPEWDQSTLVVIRTE